MKRGTIKPIIYFLTGVLGTVTVIFFYSFKKINNAEATVDVQQDGRLQYKWYPPELPKTMYFANEKVPLDRQEIREQLDRELMSNYYGIYSILYILKETTRYFPLIEERLKENGVPDDFKYLCVAESALQNQTSRAGAVGFWQFMKDTAPRYGLEVDDDVDERYNVLKSTDAACRYFKEAYARFGNWTAAAASYNCGIAGFDNYSTYQESKDYYSLMLPDETMRYIFRIIALKYLITNAAKMGFVIQPSDAYKPYQTYEEVVTQTIPDIEAYAVSKGITYRTLKTLNPWLRSHSLTVMQGKSYSILLPVQPGKQ